MSTLCKSKPARRSAKKPTAQEAKYFNNWQAVWKKWNVTSAKEQAEIRRSVRRDVLGSDRNQTTFTNTDFDVMFAAQEMLLEYGMSVWCQTSAYESIEEGKRRRYLFVIKGSIGALDLVLKDQEGEEYVQDICKGKYGHTDWQSLSANQLHKLMLTVVNRTRGHCKNLPHNSKNKDNEPF